MGGGGGGGGGGVSMCSPVMKAVQFISISNNICMFKIFKQSILHQLKRLC